MKPPEIAATGAFADTWQRYPARPTRPQTLSVIKELAGKDELDVSDGFQQRQFSRAGARSVITQRGQKRRIWEEYLEAPGVRRFVGGARGVAFATAAG